RSAVAIWGFDDLSLRKLICPRARRMAHAQTLGLPLLSGLGRLRHSAAIAAWARSAYSWLRCSAQNLSVISVSVAWMSSMPLGILADLVFAIAGFPPCGVNDARVWVWSRHTTFLEFLAAPARAWVIPAYFGPLAWRIDFQ